MPTAATITLRSASLRSIILTRLKEIGVSRYQLAHQAGLSVLPNTTFRFLRGTGDTASAHVEEMLRALGLEVVARGTPPKWPIEEPKRPPRRQPGEAAHAKP